MSEIQPRTYQPTLEYLASSGIALAGFHDGDVSTALQTQGRPTVQWDRVGRASHLNDPMVTLPLGLLGKKLYIIDPRTKNPITPQFDGIISATSDGMVCSDGGKSFAVTPTDPVTATRNYIRRAEAHSYTDNPTLLSPLFLHASHLQVTPLSPEEARTANATNRFSLAAEVEQDRTARQGRQLFSAVIAKATTIATGSNPKQLREFTDPSRLISLPEVDTDAVSGQVHISTHDRGSSVVGFIQRSPEPSNNSGSYYLVQEPVTKEVTIVSADLNKSWSSADPDYSALVSAVGQLTDTYFDALQRHGNREIVSGSNVHDLRTHVSSRKTLKTRKAIDQHNKQYGPPTSQADNIIIQ